MAPQDKAPKRLPSEENSTPETNSASPDLNLNKQIDKKRIEYEKQVDEILKQFKLSGRLAKDKLKTLRATLFANIRQSAAREMGRENAIQQAAQQQREAIEQSGEGTVRVPVEGPVEKADAQMSVVVETFRKIIDHVAKGNQIDEEGLTKVMAMMRQFENLKTNPQISELFTKLAENKPLQDPADFMTIIGFIQPIELAEASKKPQQVYESSQAGVLISMLKPPQRMRMAELIYENKEPAQATGIIEGLVATGMLSMAQLNHLINSKKLPEEERNNLQQQVEDGSLLAEQQAYREHLAMLAHANRGAGGENILNRIGMKEVGIAALGVWGSVTAFMNFAAGFQFNDISGSFRRIGTNPWFWAGSAGAAVGALSLAGNLAPETTEDAIESTREFFRGRDEKAELAQEHRNKFFEYMRRPLRENHYLDEFLMSEALSGQKQTGFEVLHALNSDLQAGKISNLDYQTLHQSLDPEQQKWLDRAMSQAPGSGVEEKKTQVMDQIRLFYLSAKGLKINTREEVAQVIADFKQDEGIETN